MSLTLAGISIIEEDQIGSLDDAELVRACHRLAVAQQDSGDRFAIPRLWSWEASVAEVERVHRTLGDIAHQPSRTARGVRAKAAALESLLQSGQADVLHDDASAPDRLAWSLVQDLLALMPSVLRLSEPDGRRPILTSA